MRFVNPKQALFQGWRASQRWHAVMSQRSLERADKSGWKSVTAHLEHAQVREKIDFGAGLFTTARVHRRIALEKRADIHEDVQNLIFTLSYLIACQRTILAPLGEQFRRSFGVNVKTQHKLAQFVEVLTGARLDGRTVVRWQRRACDRRAKNHALPIRNDIVNRNRVDLKKWSSGVDLHVGNDHYLADFSREWSHNLSLHFHGLNHGQAIAHCNCIAGLDQNGNHDRRRWRVHHAPVIAIDAVRYAIDFDPVTESLNCRDDAKLTPEDTELAFALPQTLDRSLDARSIDLDSISLRPETISLGRVAMAAIPELCRPAYFTANLRPSAHRRRIELLLL